MNQTHRGKYWHGEFAVTAKEMHNKAEIWHTNKLNERLNRLKNDFTVAARDKRLK